MLFSIVINSYNRAQSLQKTLYSLTQLRWSEFEIIVITGPSEDGSLAILEPWKDKIKQAICPFANLSRSRNQGLALASGEWVAFIDDDAMPEPDWLCRLAAHTDNKQLGAIGGFVIDHTGKQYQAQYLVSDYFGKTKNYQSLYGIPLDNDLSNDYYLSLMGVNTCFRRKALEQIGGFDQAYAYYLEETDMVLRLRKAQWQTQCIPNALVHHKFADSHIRHQHIVTSLYHIVRSRMYFAGRHGLPAHGLHAYAANISQELQALVQHQQANQNMNTGISAERLHNETQAALLDGLKMVHEIADIPKIMPSTSAKPFIPILAAEQRLHLCLVSRAYPPQAMGGIARFIQTLAHALVKQGHEVTVIAETQHDYATIDWEDGVWVHRIQPLDEIAMENLTRPNSLPTLPSHIDAFAAAVWQEVYDYQSSRKFHAVLGSIWDLDMAWLIASQTLPVWMYLVTSYHQMQDKADWQTPEQKKNLLEPMLEAEKWALKNCHILASTQAIADDTAELTQIANIADSKIIPFGLNNDHLIDNQAEVIASTSKNTLSDNTFTLLYVGRFELRKGIDCLLDIAPALIEKYPQLQIQCIGNDTIYWESSKSLREIFEQKTDNSILQRIHFLGEVSDDVLHQAYQDCDAFVAPSRYESFGLMYVEAMRAGKACIGTNIGGIPEVIAANETGLLVPPNDPQALKIAIENLLDDLEKTQRMGEAAQQRFNQKYSAEIFAKNITALFALH